MHLSDNDTQVASQIWKNSLADTNTDIMFSPIVTRKTTQAEDV
jgi:hypothetical protein